MTPKHKLTHLEGCDLAAKYLRKGRPLQPFHRCQYVVCELERVGESPDAFGWGGSTTQLIEVKVSRADFLADKRKSWRNQPHTGLGRYRAYLCPAGIIKESDLPNDWGLLYVNNKGNITEIVQAMPQECNHLEEINLITSILRREKISPRIFSYKNYKS